MKLHPIPESECSHIWANTGQAIQGVATIYCVICGKTMIPEPPTAEGSKP